MANEAAGAQVAPPTATTTTDAPATGAPPGPKAAPAEGASTAPAAPDGSSSPAAEPAAQAEPGESARALALKLAQTKAAERRLRQELEQATLTVRQFHQLREQAKTNPAAILEAFEVPFDQVLTHYAEHGREKTPEEIQAAKLSELEAWKQKQEEAAAKAAEDAQKAAVEAQVSQGKAAAKFALEQKADAYPATLALGRHDEIWEALGEYARQHELQEVTVDHLHTVAAAYETELQKALDEEYGVLVSKVPRLAARFAPPNTAPNGQGATPGTQGAQGTSAVNTTARSTSEAPPPTAGKRLSREESIRLAAEAARAAAKLNATA